MLPVRPNELHAPSVQGEAIDSTTLSKLPVELAVSPRRVADQWVIDRSTVATDLMAAPSDNADAYQRKTFGGATRQRRDHALCGEALPLVIRDIAFDADRLAEMTSDDRDVLSHGALIPERRHPTRRQPLLVDRQHETARPTVDTVQRKHALLELRFRHVE